MNHAVLVPVGQRRVTYCVRAPHPPSERQTDAGQLPPWLLGVALFAAVSRANSLRALRALRGNPLCENLPVSETPICSAKGCRAGAVWVLAWNNPKIHTPERRKTWIACEEHREHLSQFLGVRGFLKDVVPLREWEDSAADR